MEIVEIAVYKKDTKDLVAIIFEGEEGIKQFTHDDYEVAIETKDPHKYESNV